MKIETTQVTKLTITNLDRLDPVHVFTEDLGVGKGRITISCYNKSWTAYWEGMSGKILSEFFCSCSEDYLAKNLSNMDSEIIDYKAVSGAIVEEVNGHNLMFYSKKLEDEYGGEWFRYLPMKPNHDYQHLCRIIKVVQQEFRRVFYSKGSKHV